jgi:YVTN family beta-propeller protein
MKMQLRHGGKLTWLLFAVLALAAPGVALAGKSQVSSITFGKVAGKVAGNAPVAVAADPALNIVYVASRGSNTISVIDGQTTKVIATIARPSGGLSVGVAVNSVTHLVYDLDAALNEVLVVDGVSRATVIKVAVPATPQAIAVDESANRVYVTTSANGAANLVAINGATNAVLWTRPIGTDARGVAVDPRNKRVYVADPSGNVIRNYDETSGAQTGLRPLAGGPTAIAIDSVTNASTIWVASPTTSSIKAIATGPNHVYDVALGATPTAIAVNPENHRAYVTASAKTKLGVVTAGTLTIVAGPINNGPPAVAEKLIVGQAPAGAAVDLANFRVFVANAGTGLVDSSGSVSVVSRFDPLADGFHFPNAFTYQINVNIPGFGTVNMGSFPYGLCGGMVFAALDTYKAGGRTPATGTQMPAQNSQVRSTLTHRLLDSLLPDNLKILRRFLDWEARPYHSTYTTGLKSLSYKEFKNKIRPQLDLGNPVPLGLVKVDRVSHPTDPPWGDHQVLATGYFFQDPQFVIELYDPNVPDQFVYLWTNDLHETFDAAGHHVVPHSSFRGYFANEEYGFKRPFWVL